jgi:phosphoglycerate dehydrogenase-like enzyme
MVDQVTIAIAQALADDHGARIQAAAGGGVRLLALRGDEGEAPLDDVEIAVSGLYEGQLSFSELVARMPNLRWIHSTGAGIDSFVSPELAERGVIVTNSSGIYTPAMVEYVLGGMVAIARDFRRLFAQQDERRWDHEPVSGKELYGRRVGIVGYGETGRYLARVCKALGMEVWATRRRPMVVTGEPLDRLLPSAELHELLGACDYVVVAASLNSTTRHLLGEAEFRAFRPGAVLVNVARGGLVDQEALLAALDDGRVAGAFLDVVEPEPLPSDSPLWAHPRVVVTSHISGGSPEGWERAVDLFCRNLPLYLAGETSRLGNLVDLSDHL